MNRRKYLAVTGAALATALAGCGSPDDTGSPANGTETDVVGGGDETTTEADETTTEAGAGETTTEANETTTEAGAGNETTANGTTTNGTTTNGTATTTAENETE